LTTAIRFGFIPSFKAKSMKAMLVTVNKSNLDFFPKFISEIEGSMFPSYPIKVLVEASIPSTGGI